MSFNSPCFFYTEVYLCTFQLFIDATKITNFWSQHNLFLHGVIYCHKPCQFDSTLQQSMIMYEMASLWCTSVQYTVYSLQ